MADNPITLSQDELNDIFSNIRKDNSENEKKIDSPNGLSLSQKELDKLVLKSEASKSNTPSLFSAAARAAKIAARNARSSQLIEQMNENSPKRIYVIFGSAVRKGKELGEIKEGDTLELDRLADEYAEILVDGKLFARGIPISQNGKTSVKIVEKV